jgi:hypothetical protein
VKTPDNPRPGDALADATGTKTDSTGGHSQSAADTASPKPFPPTKLMRRERRISKPFEPGVYGGRQCDTPDQIAEAIRDELFLDDVVAKCGWALLARIPADGGKPTCIDFPGYKPSLSDDSPLRRRIGASMAEEAKAQQRRQFFEEDENFYFHANLTTKHVRHRLKEVEVEHIHFFQVDIDPRKLTHAECESWTDEQKSRHRKDERLRILQRIQQFATKHGLPPTVVIDSGNGYQCLWWTGGLRVGADISRDDARAINSWLAQELKADGCQSLDHLFRLPGTVNLPNLTKRKQGRTRTVATIYAIDWTRRFRPDQFQKSQPPSKGQVQQRLAAPDTGLVATHAAGKLDRLEPHHQRYIDELERWDRSPRPLDLDRVSTGTRAMFSEDRTGTDDKSGSQWLVQMAGAAMRDGIPADEVAAALLSGEHPGARHVDDQDDQERAVVRAVVEAIAGIDVAQIIQLSKDELSALDVPAERLPIKARVKRALKDGKAKPPPSGMAETPENWARWCAEQMLAERVAPKDVLGALLHPGHKIRTAFAKAEDAQALVNELLRARNEKQRKQAEVRRGAICLDPGNLDAALDGVVAQLAASDAQVFSRGGKLVMPIRVDGTLDQEDDDIERADGSLLLHQMDAHGVRSTLAKHCRFIKDDAAADPDVTFANTLLAGRERWRFPVLNGVTGVPVFRADGSVFATPGYDAVTKLWFDPGDLVVPDIPESPTLDDAKAAIHTLMHPFRAFPIPRPECRAVLLSALVSVVITNRVNAVPAIGVSASAPGFGKTLVQNCIGAMAIGCEAPSMTYTGDDTEDEKRFDAVLMAGDPIIAMDNVSVPVGGDTLCSIVTNPVHQCRRLGKSEMPKVSSRVQIIANGNNLVFRGDMASRRALLILIEDDTVEKPETREFDFHPFDEMLANRSAMVGAALTILRAWHVAGRPRCGLEPFGSFEGWEDVRRALVWAGEADPVLTKALVAADDPDREADELLLSEIERAVGTHPFRVTDLKNHAEDPFGKVTVLGQYLLNGRKWTPQRAGARIRALKGRWFGDLRLMTTHESKGHGNVWCIERRDGSQRGAEGVDRDPSGGVI